MKTQLGLYREAFRDVNDVDITRYLFDAPGCAIMVWVHDSGALHSFQADWRDNIYLCFKQPSLVTVKRRTDEPIDGAMSEDVSDEDRTRIHDLVSTFHHDDFPVLFALVRSIASGNDAASLKLPDRELKQLRGVQLADLHLLSRKNR